jgi:4-hydroxy-tetrahydrodipicolinate synthase
MSSPLSNFTGVVAASVTPFNADYTIDRKALSENVRFLAKQPGIRGVLVNGLAAEVTSLTRMERTDIISWVRSEVADGYPVISCISAQSTQEAVEMAKEAVRAGATALLVTAPSLFARGGASDPEAPVHFFQTVAGEANAPVLVFQHQVASGLCYPAKTLVRICSIPNVIGIKSTVWDQEIYEREWAALKAMPKPPLVLSGNDTLLLSNFAFASDGAILGIANLLPGPIVEIFEHAQSGNLSKARDSYFRILSLVHVIYQPPAFRYYSRMKEAMVMLGMLKEATVRPPLMPITDSERSALREALKSGGLL